MDQTTTAPRKKHRDGDVMSPQAKKTASTGPAQSSSTRTARLLVERCEAHAAYVGTVVQVSQCSGDNALVLGAVEGDCDISFPMDDFMSSRYKI